MSDYRATYRQMFKDPRWQRKRLEVMSRDGFGCVQCGVKTVTLNVHHRYYESGRAPWEYPDDALQTLCENCHETITDVTRRLKAQLGRLDHGAILQVLGYAVGMEAIGKLFAGDAAKMPPGAHGVRLFVHEAFTMGLSAAVGLPEHLLHEAADAGGNIEFERLLSAAEKYAQSSAIPEPFPNDDEGDDP